MKTVKEMKSFCVANGVDIKGCKVRADYEACIAAFKADRATQSGAKPVTPKQPEPEQVSVSMQVDALAMSIENSAGRAVSDSVSRQSYWDALAWEQLPYEKAQLPSAGAKITLTEGAYLDVVKTILEDLDGEDDSAQRNGALDIFRMESNRALHRYLHTNGMSKEDAREYRLGIKQATQSKPLRLEMKRKGQGQTCTEWLAAGIKTHGKDEIVAAILVNEDLLSLIEEKLEL